MLTGPSSAFSLLSVIYLLYIFSVLSRKLGRVTKMKPYYRGFYWAMGLIGLALAADWLRLTAQMSPQLLPRVLLDDRIYLFIYDLPLAAAVTLSLGVAWHYWSWLFKEHGQ
jgi:hypothetical protein